MRRSRRFVCELRVTPKRMQATLLSCSLSHNYYVPMILSDEQIVVINCRVAYFCKIGKNVRKVASKQCLLSRTWIYQMFQ